MSNQPQDIDALARSVWESFDDNERFGASFAMFPHDKMPRDLSSGDSRALAVALMQLAKES